MDGKSNIGGFCWSKTGTLLSMFKELSSYDNNLNENKSLKPGII